jgi:hypothetical protein
MASLVAGVLAPACSANPLLVGREIDGGEPITCSSAGGTCLPGPDASAGRDAGTADAYRGDQDGGQDDGGSGGACRSAGGTCLPASVACAPNAPTGAQDCSSGPNPAGAHCCLALSDAGSDRDGAAADAAPVHDDGGNSDSGAGAACAAAGGTCIGPTVNCLIGAPAGAPQISCLNPEAGASFCCLRVQ